MRYKHRLHVFIGSFVFIFFMLHALFQWLGSRQAILFQDEIKIMHAEIENRFKLLIDNNESILKVLATVTSDWKNTDKTYQGLASKILINFEEILDLNFVDSKGVVVKVAPLEKNNLALGKRSQNFDELVESLQNGEKFFVSPPFDLFQGIRGIAFYFPVFNGSEFLGWIAIVQGLDRFMENFVSSKFLGAYHLVIQDSRTGRPYYASAKLPADAEVITKNIRNIKGREVQFISWRKEKFLKSYVPLPTLILFSLVLSFLASLSFWAIELKMRTRKELANIEVLLRVTFNSTSNNLNSIQEQLELIKMGSGFVPLNKISGHVAYLSTLIDRLRSLVNISDSKVAEVFERTSILPMIGDLSKVLSSRIQSKDLRLSFDPQDFLNVEIQTKHWILANDILENVLTYFISISAPGDHINLIMGQNAPFPSIMILNSNQTHSIKILEGKITDGLTLASSALASENGKLVLENNEDGALAIITIPNILSFTSLPGAS